jgi:hypothetical protein
MLQCVTDECLDTATGELGIVLLHAVRFHFVSIYLIRSNDTFRLSGIGRLSD